MKTVVPLESMVDPARPITYGIVLPGPDVPDGVPYVRVVDIKDGAILAEQLRRTTPEIAQSYRRSMLAEGDLLVSIRGHVGRTAFVPRAAAGANLTQDTARVAIHAGAEPRFVRWFIESPAARHWMTQHTKGVAVTGINLSDLRKLPVPCLSLSEQRRIADILDKADAIRRKHKDAIAHTEELLRSAFLEMFGDPVTNPKSWPVKGLLDVCSAKQWPTIAASELSGSGYPVFGANGIIGYHSELNHAEATVLITCRGATCGTINVCLPNSYVTGNAMALDDPDSRTITREYLEWVLRLRGLKDTITGSAQPQITRQSLQKVAFPVPPVKTQQVFGRLLQGNAHVRASLERAGAEADDLFHSLVARAFSGTLESSR